MSDKQFQELFSIVRRIATDLPDEERIKLYGTDGWRLLLNAFLDEIVDRTTV